MDDERRMSGEGEKGEEFDLMDDDDLKGCLLSVEAGKEDDLWVFDLLGKWFRHFGMMLLFFRGVLRLLIEVFLKVELFH